jgi:hypothetical protein
MDLFVLIYSFKSLRLNQIKELIPDLDIKNLEILEQHGLIKRCPAFLSYFDKYCITAKGLTYYRRLYVRD